MQDNQPQILTDAAGAARLLSISKSFFYQNLSTGRININPIRLSAKRLYSVAALIKWAEAENKKVNK